MFIVVEKTTYKWTFFIKHKDRTNYVVVDEENYKKSGTRYWEFEALSKEEAQDRCDKFNAHAKAARYRIFMDGNEKFFVCVKIPRFISYKPNQSFEDENKVTYLKLNYFPGRVNIIPDEKHGGIICVPFDKDHKPLKKGFDTLEEACEMLKLIKKREEEEENEREIERKRDVGIPMECPQ